jgi:hypothetical protein
MDLANIIVDSAANAFKEECESKICDISLTLRGRYKYLIQIVPMNKHVLIKYKTLEYKVAKDNKEDYNSIISFLFSAINDDISMKLNDDIEYEGYWPGDDEYYHINSLEMKRINNRIFYIQFKYERFEEVFNMYLATLRNIQ